MRFSNFEVDGQGSYGRVIDEIRSLQGVPGDVSEAVASIIERVKSGGDSALAELTVQFDGVNLASDKIEVEQHALNVVAESIDSKLRASLELAIENIRTVAQAQLPEGAKTVDLPAGQSITLSTAAVERVGVYVPGGRAAYPSTVLMATVPAKVAGVGSVVVCCPPGPDGINPAVLAACALTGVDRVYAVGGAQAIAALALGTESVESVDVIVGPGNSYVQEAKRQLFGTVGIDSVAGPSELLVLLDSESDLRLAALDLLAQAEHGEESLVSACSQDQAVLDQLQELMGELGGDRPSVCDVSVALVKADSIGSLVDFANLLAPEHVELLFRGADEYAGKMTRCGCVFIGSGGATAFGDYIAGSNHILPTGGAARYASAVGVGTYLRRFSTVSIPPSAAEWLAQPLAEIASAEGFPVHAESALARRPDG